jgi:predicted nucleotidyltransferase
METATNQPVQAKFDASRVQARWRAEASARRARSVALLADVREKAAPVLRRFGAREAVVFGSLAAGTARVDSDIDLVVLGTEPSAYWDMRRELEAALGRALDLFTEADDSRFVAKAQARGQVIYAAEP